MAGKKSATLVCLMIVVCGLRIGAQAAPNTALLNGNWFDGKTFKARTVYSVNGLFTLQKPSRVDHSLDLSGLWVIPPFAEAHNHNISTGVSEWDKKAIANYIRDGVFYVKIQGNLPIMPDEARSLGVNNGNGPDVIFSQGAITASGGHPIGLIETVLLRRGYFPGHTKETLRDHRYFTIDSEAELDRKWPAIVAKRRDFIKVLLWAADEYEKRTASPAFFGQRALDPKLLPLIINKARARGLRVSAHVTTAADFHVAVVAGVDEINHLPYLGSEPISAPDARLAAEKKIVIVTTGSLLERLPKNLLSDSERIAVEKAQIANLKLLFANKVKLAIGSDNTSDTSFSEVMYLRKKQVFDDKELLKMWTETTGQAIFPGRKIGKLTEGYEASFLAIEGDPLVDLANVKRIKYRFKQGVLLDSGTAGN